MNYAIKLFFFVLILFISDLSFSQIDTTSVRGTIKVSKPKDGAVYIKAISNFDKYEISELRSDFSSDQVFQPFPVVSGYPYPFNYNAFFNTKLKTNEINLKEKTSDTVVMEVTVLASGKTYVKDKSRTLLVNGVPAIYDEKVGAYELNNLHLNCMNALKGIEKWFPGYVILPQKARFKRQIVIKPNKKNINFSGTIMVVFSSTPFEDS